MAGRSTESRAIAQRESSTLTADASAEDESVARPAVVERVLYRDDCPGGTVEAAIAYDVPPSVSKLALWIEHPSVTVLGTAGFERSDVGEYTWQGSIDGPAFEWDGTTERPIAFVRQSIGGDGPAVYGGGTDDWALLLRPRTHTRWRYRGPEPVIDREAGACGPGTAGEQFAFLGAYETAERAVDGEHLRLVVPEAADLTAAPDRILDSLAAASQRLDVGGRNDVVTVFVAPTDGVDWGHRGLSLGPDARVNDAAPLTAAANIWVHEYVHTRQDRSATTAATEWLLEATAEYYAATQALQRGAIDYSAFRGILERGVDGRSAEAVLADPATWTDDAQYRKGALVVAALDRRIRAATGGETTFQAVLRAWSRAETFDAAAFADAVEAAGGPAARAAAIAYTRTPTTPASWGAVAHAATFDVSPADCGVDASATELREGGERAADVAAVPPAGD